MLRFGPYGGRRWQPEERIRDITEPGARVITDGLPSYPAAPRELYEHKPSTSGSSTSTAAGRAATGCCFTPHGPVRRPPKRSPTTTCARPDVPAPPRRPHPPARSLSPSLDYASQAGIILG